MNRIKVVLVAILLALPIICLIYKTSILGIQVVPSKAGNFWEVELIVNQNLPRDYQTDEFYQPIVPVPETNKYQVVENLRLNGSLVEEEDEVSDEEFSEDFQKLEVDPDHLQPFNLTFQVQPANPTVPNRNVKMRLGDRERREFLRLDDYTEMELVLLRKLADTLIFPNDDAQTRFEKFFYYLADEISLKHESKKISDIVELSSGSFLAQARTLVGLARLSGIPARVIYGAKFLEPKPSNPVRYTRVFLTEVFMQSEWKPYLPEDRIDGRLDGHHLIFCRTCEQYARFLENGNYVKLLINPVKFDPLSSEEQLESLKKTSPFWASLSLHRLPISVQAIILGIILVPFGTIAISFARVILGIETFGIFMPILLTLFFIETSFVFGMSFFAIVVMLGLGQRFLLDRFYLLSVPRLSILLSFTIIIYLLFSVFCLSFDILAANQRSLGYFPIVIITVFIEKLSLSLMEEGGWNTFKTAVGTFVVSFFCFGFLYFSWLKSFLFNNPEMILFSIGMNMLIGSYTGFRLTELFRFNEVKGTDAVDFTKA